MNFNTLPRGLPNSAAESGQAPRALWGSPHAIAQTEFWRYDHDKIFLGGIGDKLIGIKDNRHLTTIAGSRAGKGVNAIIPNLLLYSGSTLTLDPKGENASITAQHRAQKLGHDVFVIDPFEIADVPDEYRAGYNPLASIDPDSITFIDDCDSVADALVVEQSTKNSDYWNSSARTILRGFIAWVVATMDEPDLVKVRQLLYLAPKDEDEPHRASFDETMLDMINNPDIAYGVPAEAASALIDMSENERSGVLSTTRENISFLASPPMAHALSNMARNVDLTTWKFGGSSIYLCLPASRLHRHNRFFRLFINRLLADVERTLEAPDIPALMILDEAHVLGHMSILSTAIGLFAGYGVRIWSFWQDLNQLRDLYRDRWETFLGNSGMIQVFGLNDNTTLKYISERLGVSTVLQVSKGEILDSQALQGFSGESRSMNQAGLLTPDEVAYFFSRQSENQLILYPGADPIFMDRISYYNDIFNEVRE